MLEILKRQKFISRKKKVEILINSFPLEADKGDCSARVVREGREEGRTVRGHVRKARP